MNDIGFFHVIAFVIFTFGLIGQGWLYFYRIKCARKMAKIMRENGLNSPELDIFTRGWPEYKIYKSFCASKIKMKNSKLYYQYLIAHIVSISLCVTHLLCFFPSIPVLRALFSFIFNYH